MSVRRIYSVSHHVRVVGERATHTHHTVCADTKDLYTSCSSNSSASVYVLNIVDNNNNSSAS